MKNEELFSKEQTYDSVCSLRKNIIHAQHTRYVLWMSTTFLTAKSMHDSWQKWLLYRKKRQKSLSSLLPIIAYLFVSVTFIDEARLLWHSSLNDSNRGITLETMRMSQSESANRWMRMNNRSKCGYCDANYRLIGLYCLTCRFQYLFFFLHYIIIRCPFHG